MTDIDIVMRKIRKKKKFEENNKAKMGIKTSTISKVLLLIILFLGTLIYSKTSKENKMLLYETVFEKNISFASINNLYNKYLGGILPFDSLFKEAKPVFKEKLEYKSSNIYKDGVQLTVANKYLVPVQESGIIVFIGEKEEYGNTVIVQQINGIDLWYANVQNVSVKMYDYVEKGSLLGETIDDKLYLVYKKEGKALDYKEYLK